APRCSPPPPRCSPPPPRSPPPRTLAQCSGAPPPFVLCLGRSGSPDPSPRAPSPSRPLRRHFDQTNHQSKLTRTMSFLRPRRVPVGGRGRGCGGGAPRVGVRGRGARLAPRPDRPSPTPPTRPRHP